MFPVPIGTPMAAPLAAPMMSGMPYMFQLVTVPMFPDGRVVMSPAPMFYASQPMPAGGVAFAPSIIPPKPKKKRHHFTVQDDERLTKIMENHQQPLKNGEWKQVAAEMGDFTPQQCQERWTNYLRPPLDRSDLGLEERRLLVKYAVTDYGKWKQISEKAQSYKIRSPALIKNYLVCQFRKMNTLGIRPQIPEEVDCIPDSVFLWGMPKDQDAVEVREKFATNKEIMKEKWELENFGEEEEEEDAE